MALITSKKHTTSRFNQHMSTALAVLLLPVAAQAADAVAPADTTAQTQSQAQPQTMPAVTAVGDQDPTFRAVKAASPKYTETLTDTAQTITVIKKELIEQQGAVTLTDALRNTPGVGTFFLGENGSTNTGDAIYMRGFDASSSIYVDNIRDVGSISRDVFNIEQIDVLKGPSGTDSGRGSPTGSINLTSKQPMLENANTIAVTGGSGSQKRATADLNRVIDADSGTAFRLNLMDQDSGNPARDVVNNKRWAVAPSLVFGLNTPTRVFVDYLHVKQNNVPDGGVPTFGLPGYTSSDPTRPFLSAAAKVDPNGFYGASSDFDNVTADMVTVMVQHDFSPTTKFENVSRYGKTTEKYILTSFTSTAANIVTPNPADPSTWQLLRTNRNVKDQDNEIVTNQSNITADFATGGVKHTLVAGLELTNEKQSTYGYANTGTLPAESLYSPNPDLPVAALNPVRNGVRADGTMNTVSTYAFDTIKVGERWILNGGLRVDHYSTTFDAIALSTLALQPKLPVGTLVPTNLDLSGNLVNGKLSALYKPTADSSVYALWATSKQPPGGSNFTLSTAANNAGNAAYQPEETTTEEIGGKWDLLKQKVSLTGALYRTTVSNDVEQDPIDLQYYQTGKKRVQGVEIGITGELMRNWLISAGYTHMNTTIVSGKIATQSGANDLAYTPKDAFTSWTSYTLPFGLQVGGGLRYVGKLMRGTDGAIGTPAYADAYWVADAMVAYPVTKNIDLRLNVYNLADKAYVAAINKSGYRYTPGTPRSASLTASFKF
jgi:catecholate siderophore receptor